MRVDGMKVKSNTEALAGLADLASRTDPSLAVVEIGVYQGGSLATIAKNTTAHCYGIDPWTQQPDVYADRPRLISGFGPQNQAIARANLKAAGVTGHTTLIRGFSLDAAASWAHGPVGFLYIDGNHAYDAVLADFNAWLPHLAAGCLIAFDDYDHSRPRFATVIRAVDELTDAGFIEPPTVIGGRLAVTSLRP